MTDTSVTPSIIAPAPGTTLRGAVEIFTWDLGGIPVEETWLLVGDQAGGSQYAAKSVGAATTTSVGDLPADGSTVFARIWYKTGGEWFEVDAEYTAASEPGLPTFVDPVPGATLEGEAQQFRWALDGLPVGAWWVYAGTVPAGSDLGAQFTGTDTVTTFGSLPTDGSTVHLRLYFRVEGWWYFVDETFEAATVAVPDRDELTRELQRLVGVDDDGIIGPITMAALNRNWLGLTGAFDAAFAERFTNADDVVRWVQRRLNTRAGAGLDLDGQYGPLTETAVLEHLERGGVVAAESFITLLDP